jgi:hypothetical protein
MSPTGAANGDSTSHSRRSTPQRRLLTADDRVALPELVVAPVQPKVGVRTASSRQADRVA